MLASRVQHLTIDMLPPLADYDDAQNLMQRSMHVRSRLTTHLYILTRGEGT